jgi:transposase
MILESKGLRAFIYNEAIDMRCGFERLYHFIREKMNQKVSEGHIYLFLGKNRKRLKALYFDGSGFVLVHKRMEKNNFMSVEDLSEHSEITLSELKLIFHGSVLRKPVLDRMRKIEREKNLLPIGAQVISSHAPN